MPGGRPSKWTVAIGEEICLRLTAGESLLKMCKSHDHLPDDDTVRRWLIGQGGPKGEALEEFRVNYDKARLIYADHMFDDITEIADEAGEQFNTKQRLQIDTRKWQLARMNRAKYGERAAVDLGGQDGGEIKFSWKTPQSEDE